MRHARLLERVAARLRDDGRAVLTSDRHSDNIAASWELSLVAGQLAQQQFSTNDRHVFFLDGAREFTWFSSLLRAAEQLQLRERSLRHPDQILPAVRGWLRTHDNWLVVIDHADDPERVAPLLDGVTRGNTLLISPGAEDNVSSAAGESLEPLTTSEARQSLQRTCDASGQPYETHQLEVLSSIFTGHALALEVACRLIAAGARLDQLHSALQVPDATASPLSACLRMSLRALEKRAPNLKTLVHATALADGITPQRISAAESARLQVLGLFSRHPLFEYRRMPPAAAAALRKAVGTSAESMLKAAVDEYGTKRIDTPRHLDDDVEFNLLWRDAIADSILTLRDESPAYAEILDDVSTAALARGAWYRASQILVEQLQIVRDIRPHSNHEIGALLVRIGRTQKAGQRFLMARRYFRHALESLHDDPTAVAETLLEIVEADLNESRVDRALLRLRHVATLHQKYGVPAIDRRSARRMFLQGAAHLATQNLDVACETLTKSLEIYESVLERDHIEVLKNRSVLARAHFAANDVDAAEQVLREDLAIRESSPEVLTNELSVSSNLLAEILLMRGQFLEAEPLLERVLQIREQMLESDHRLVAESLNRLAATKSARGGYDEAAQLFDRALKLTESLFGPDHPEVARQLNDRAESLFAQGRYREARDSLDRALKIQQATLRHTDRALNRTRSNLAALHVTFGQFAEAEKLYEEALDAWQQSDQQRDAVFATILNNLGEVTRAQGRLDVARGHFERALEIRERTYGSRHPVVAQALTNLGHVALLGGHTSRARELLTRAIEIREQMLSSTHPHIASSLLCLGETEVLDGNFDEARVCFQRAEEIFSRVYGPDHAQTAHCQAQTARVDLKLGKRARAELVLLKARATLEKAVGPLHRLAIEPLLGLGELYLAEGKVDKALPLLTDALELHRQFHPSGRLSLASCLHMLGRCHADQGRPAEARPLFDEACTLLTNLRGSGHPDLADCLTRLGRACESLQDHQAAATFLERALAAWEAMDAPPVDRLHATVGSLADAFAALKRFDEAEQLLTRQLSLCEADPDQGGDPIQIQSRLAGIKYLQGDYDQAEPLIRACLEESRTRFGENHPETAKHLENLAGLYFLQKRYDEAEPLITAATEILEQTYGPTHELVHNAIENYAKLLRKANRIEEAKVAENRLAGLKNRNVHVLDEIL